MDDLQNVFTLVLENSMELNETKFQLLQHGKNLELKQPYQLTSNIVFSGKAEVIKGLGVIVDPDLTWKPHIAHIIRKANTMASWTLKLFKTRDPQHLLTLYKTYCCPVWHRASGTRRAREGRYRKTRSGPKIIHSENGRNGGSQLLGALKSSQDILPTATSREI